MAPPLLSAAFLHDTRKSSTYTTTALKRWSCQSQGNLPAISNIKTIHVYDFDNTLFASPLPNPQLWNGPTMGFLQSRECFANGGWWHDPNILGATGQGLEVEEPLAWKGWWNEQIVQLIELSMQQRDALTVLLTGRAEGPFSDLIKRMLKSKGLVFDIICLKPNVGPNSQRFNTTMNFKQCFLEDLILTYKEAYEIRIYEDRSRHVKGFRDYLEQFNRLLLNSKTPSIRKPIMADVIQVGEETTYLSPVAETAEIQRMINSHNLALTTAGANITKSPYGRLQIKKTIFYTGYILSNADSSRLIQHFLLPQVPSGFFEAPDVKIMANNILITTRSAPKPILAKVGGIGKTVRWRVTGTGTFDNKLWVARVAPLVESERIHTDNPEPIIVLALRKGVRPVDAGKVRNWEPVKEENSVVFDATVGEKMILRIEEEQSEEGEWAPTHMNKGNKRRYQYDSREEDALVSHRDHSNVRGRHAGPEIHAMRPQFHSRNLPDGGNRYYPDESNRRGGGPSGSHTHRGNRGRGGRGGRGGGRSRGRGAGPGANNRDGHPSWYKSLDDHHYGGNDGPGDERGPSGSGDPVMNY